MGDGARETEPTATRPLRRNVWIFIASCAIGSLIYLLGARIVAPVAPALAVDAESLDLGDLWADPDFEHTFSVRNSTNATIKIDRFETSCTCLGVEPSTATLAGGAAREFRVHINLLSAFRPSANQNDGGLRGGSPTARSFSATIMPRIQHLPEAPEVAQPGPWFVKARVSRAIEFEPRSLFLGELVCRSAQQSHEVVVVAHVPIRDVLVQCDPKMATVKRRLDPSATATGHARYLVSIQPKNGIDPGELRFTVDASPLGHDGVRLGRARLDVRAHVRAQIEALPRTVVFGPQPIGTTVTETVRLRSLLNADFAVVRIDAEPSESIEIVPCERADAHSYEIRARIRTLGSSLAHVTFHAVLSPSGERIAVPLVLSCFGTAKE